jgi:uncharacterized protein with FMN-binding domain
MFKSHISKFITAFFSFLVFIAIMLTDVAYAQTAPQGSYQKSCNSFKASDGTLLASCRKKNGDYIGTSLEAYSQCIGDISNQDGNLNCLKNKAIPTGSYLKTCYKIAISGGTLSANCRKKNGNYIGTSLGYYSQCKGDINNLDGNLNCLKDFAIPKGSYQQTCYGIAVSGDTLSATCRTKNEAFIATSLPSFKTCSADISNKDGRLICTNSGRPPYQPPPKQQYPVCIVNNATGSRTTSSYEGYSSEDAASELFFALAKSNYGGVGVAVYPYACQ